MADDFLTGAHPHVQVISECAQPGTLPERRYTAHRALREAVRRPLTCVGKEVCVFLLPTSV